MADVALPGVYRLTFADWLEYPDDGRLYELIDGELFVTPPPNIEHQRISRDLEYVLVGYLRKTRAGEVLDAPVGVKLGDEDVLEPDLVVVLTENADRIGPQAIEGAPDLVVEILSPGTARRDLGSKRRKHEEAGVREYWIVDPASRSVEVLTRSQEAFERAGLYRRGEELRSVLLADLTVALDDVFPAG
jgi:Uma2 family endonuclease